MVIIHPLSEILLKPGPLRRRKLLTPFHGTGNRGISITDTYDRQRTAPAWRPYGEKKDTAQTVSFFSVIRL